MSFLYPYFLFGLIAVSIPILIHLFNLRTYKVVYFSNIEFLKNIKQETKAKSQLKQLLILLMRILAVSSLVFAFSQPYFPVAENVQINEKQAVGIYIDNSFSMEAESKNGNLLEVAKMKAREIVEAHSQSTEFYLITNDFNPKYRNKITKEYLLEQIAEVRTGAAARKISEIFSRQQLVLSQNRQANKANVKEKNTLFILSDLQKSSSDYASLLNDSSINVRVVPLTTQVTNNLYIDSCWFETPYRRYNQQEELFVRIVNKSSEAYNDIPVKLLLNDSLRALGSFNISENSYETVKLSFSNTRSGIIYGQVEISDYPVTFDNVYYFSYNLAEVINILLINENDSSRYLSALFRNDNYFNLKQTNFQQVQASQFSNFQCIILNELSSLSTGLSHELSNYAHKGGTVIILPSMLANTADYNFLFNLVKTAEFEQIDSTVNAVETINYQHRIYKNVFQRIEENVDLPVVLKHFSVRSSVRSTDENLLVSKRKSPLLREVHHGKGSIFISTFPLDEKISNFVKHALFVPTFYNIVLSGQSQPSIYQIIGKDEIVTLNNFSLQTNYNVFRITQLKGTFDFIPQHSTSNESGELRLLLHGNVQQAGNYTVSSSDVSISGLAFNYNRSESELEYYTKSELADILKTNNLNNFTIIDATEQDNMVEAVREISSGKQLWKYFIFFALIFLAAEIILIRWF